MWCCLSIAFLQVARHAVEQHGSNSELSYTAKIITRCEVTQRMVTQFDKKLV
jgi:hypothetical protein